MDFCWQHPAVYFSIEYNTQLDRLNIFHLGVFNYSNRKVRYFLSIQIKWIIFCGEGWEWGSKGSYIMFVQGPVISRGGPAFDACPPPESPTLWKFHQVVWINTWNLQCAWTAAPVCSSVTQVNPTLPQLVLEFLLNCK